MDKTNRKNTGYLDEMNDVGILLMLSNADTYSQTSIDVLQHLVTTKNLPGVYVSFSKPYDTLKKTLEDVIDLEMVTIIDGMTMSTVGRPDKKEECIYLSSLSSLSDLGIVITQAVKAIKNENKFILIDSLSTLFIYNNQDTVSKFMHYIIGNMRVWGVCGILLSLDRESDKDFLEQLSLFCDKTIKLSDENKC